jgi:hypothetical protein
MGFAAIDSYGQKWKGLAVQRMRRISNGDVTRHLLNELGILLYLILR